MTKVLKILSDKFVSKRHRLIIKEANVLEVLDVINHYSSWYIDKKIIVDKYDWDDGYAEWFIKFKASNDQWTSIINELNDKDFKLVIKEVPEYIFVLK